jgi:hypothetical protein
MVCWLICAGIFEFSHHVLSLSHVVQITAVTCGQTSGSSKPSTTTVRVKQYMLQVSLTLGGSLTPADIASSPKLKQQLIDGAANALGVSKALVQLTSVSNKGGRRRILDVSVTFQILALSEDELKYLQNKAYSADFQKSIRQAGGNVQVSSVDVAIVKDLPDAGSTQNISKNDKNTTTIIAAAVGSVGGAAIITAAVVFSVCMWQRWAQEQMRKSALLQNQYAAPTAPPSIATPQAKNITNEPFQQRDAAADYNRTPEARNPMVFYSPGDKNIHLQVCAHQVSFWICALSWCGDEWAYHVALLLVLSYATC